MISGVALFGVRRPRPWLMLALGVFAQASATVLVSTPAFLIPLLHTQRGMSLAAAGTLAAAPTLGMVVTLIAWGALTDRIGERLVIAVGLLLASAAAVAAALIANAVPGGYLSVGVLLFVGGMMAASPNAASGRLVVGWFSRDKRGLAMGIRQMCQPLGVAVAAIAIPPLASAGGIAAALTLPAILTLLSAVACAIWIVDPRPSSRPVATPQTPPQATATAPTPAPALQSNPYRTGAVLWRIHLASMLLVVPQFTVSTFGLVWLISEWHWPTAAAGVLVGACQFIGAIGRIGVGALSDRVGSRLRPLRWVAYSAVAVMAALAATGILGGWAVAPLLVLASIVTVADNGLAYTAVAEIAGATWSGRALGAQNTGQFLAASAVGPVVGGLIGLVGYPIAFAVVALAPLAAVPLVPVRSPGSRWAARDPSSHVSSR
ncbi:MAG TPA: MFS transporter [Microbacteriaceae bacterium]